ncbi:MAG TPA: spore germination protein GerW family protein [Bacillota bacterium]|nr:spore germination protein GerW family protein [Bacillota bacterium]HNT04360.1 spore germination protein GerW family protein [Bacillota bacterium]HPA54884.1 spore germination protein GerW family protein [Bacillota bacterium]HPX69302.1 spore germination protein GerW family protein [Bacillota bacterium]HQA65713.1 spore germination protein GerW family protein [Bacillota bacterium]
MESKTPVNESLETLFSHLEKFLKTETVIGEPIVVGETTLIPIITVAFGCGGGGGGGKDEKGNDGMGTGVGVGAKISPDAVIVIKQDSVTMLPVKNRSNIEKLVGMVPEIVKKIKLKKEEKSCCAEEKSE